MKKLLNLIDGLLGRTVSGLMYLGLYLGLGAGALLIMVGVPMLMFEYGEGMQDLDQLEQIILLLLGLTLWRYIGRCRQQGWAWWQALARLVHIQGMYGLILVFAAAAAGMQLNDGHLSFALAKPAVNIILALIYLGVILLIYGAAPLPPLLPAPEESGQKSTDDQPEVKSQSESKETQDLWGPEPVTVSAAESDRPGGGA